MLTQLCCTQTWHGFNSHVWIGLGGPHTTICVRILLCICPHTAMCPHTRRVDRIRRSAYYYMCLHTAIYMYYVPAFCYMSACSYIRILLCVSSYCSMCPHTTTRVSSYYFMHLHTAIYVLLCILHACVLILYIRVV